MKNRGILISLCVLSTFSAVAQCGDPTFTKENTVREVKTKLTCYANQNATLQQNLSEAQTQSTKLTQDLTQAQSENARLKQELEEMRQKVTSDRVHLSISTTAYNPNQLSVPDCKSHTIQSGALEDAHPIGAGPTFQGVELSGWKAMVICAPVPPIPLGIVIVASHSDNNDTITEQNANRFGERLAQAVFGPAAIGLPQQ